jgi:DNA-binding NtrC family response regulator
MPHALIVDDSAATLSALVELVSAEGFTTSAALTVDRAKVELSRQSPDIVLADLNLPDGTGMHLLDAVERSGASPAVVFITGQASVDTAVEALRRGVTDYLTKPLDVNRLREILSDVSRTGHIGEEIVELRAKQKGTGRFAGIVGRSEPILKLGELLGRIAPSSASVLVSGESGSGKEVVARTIHELSRRRHGPFVPVNCGAISPTLMESELFGHEKGSFTGAERRHKGYFEQATRGTLFLDEITEMPAELQVKLLRVLETSTFTRVGGEQSLSVDVRIVAASNRDVNEALEQGKLREDLYYRLKVFQLHLPPLRERPGDIALLAQHFLDELERVERAKKRLGDDALALMSGYRWPGNVRELRNVVQSGYILASSDVITADCLPPELRGRATESRPVTAVEGVVTVRPGTTIADAERMLIFATLRQFGGDKTRAAESLGISLKTLYNRLHAYEKDEQAAEAAGEGEEEPGPALT